MPLLNDLLADLPDGAVTDLTIGLHWTAVTLDVAGETRCGLASTLRGGHDHRATPDVPDAGRLAEQSGRDLAALIRADSLTLRSVGFAALNALLPRQPARWTEINAADVIAARGAGQTVALIGHFPFVKQLREQVGALHILEQQPQPGDLPAEAAPDVLPRAGVVAITGLTLLNGTLDGLLALCQPSATVIVLGPSTPLHPAWFDYGVDLISGAVVTDIPAALGAVRQGANFRQVHKAGVRLVTLARDGMTV